MAAKQKVSKVKYAAAGVDDFQPGSHKRVLRNKLGIIRVREMDKAELERYLKAQDVLIRSLDQHHEFSCSDINHIHELFLGEIYAWAGKQRDVNLSKGGFTFAAAKFIPKLMNEFERDTLGELTPCAEKTRDEAAYCIAVVHVEFLLIHPYREGNGRTARLLATLMAYQADLPGLDFGFIGGWGKEFDRYVAAIHAGLSKNYDPMVKMIQRAIGRALKRNAR